MSNVQFEENNLPGDRLVPSGGLPTLVKLLLKTGLAKSEKQANYVLIGIAVCAVLLTVYVIKSSFGSSGARLNRNVLTPAALPTQAR